LPDIVRRFLRPVREIFERLRYRNLTVMDDDDLMKVLEDHGLLEKLRAGELRCLSCSATLTAENLAGFVIRQGEYQMFCDNPHCVPPTRIYPATSKASARGTVAAQKKIIEILLKQERDDGWMYLARLGQLVRQNIPDFNFARFGAHTFGDFVETIPDIEIERRGVAGSVVYVRVRRELV
jgi:hypothetical protein